MLLSGLAAVVALSGCSGDGPNRFRLDLAADSSLVAGTNIPDRFRDRIPGRAQARVFLPTGPETGPVQRVVAFFGSAADVTRASDQWAPLRDTLNAVILTVDVAGGEDSEWAMYYYLLHVLRDLKANGLVARNASLVLAGFAGGSQFALTVGNYGGNRQFDGVVAVRATVPMTEAGRAELPNQDALRLPIVILNNSGEDRTNQSVVDRLRQHGFSRVRLQEYDGGGHFPTAAVTTALAELFDTLGSRPGVYR